MSMLLDDSEGPQATSKGPQGSPLKPLISLQLYAKISFGFHVNAPQCFQRRPGSLQRPQTVPLKTIDFAKTFCQNELLVPCKCSPMLPKAPQTPPRTPKTTPRLLESPQALPKSNPRASQGFPKPSAGGQRSPRNLQRSPQGSPKSPQEPPGNPTTPKSILTCPGPQCSTCPPSLSTPNPTEPLSNVAFCHGLLFFSPTSPKRRERC